MSNTTLWDIFLKSTGAAIDSRVIKPGQLFFALPGSRTDGTKFTEHALSKGALLAIVPENTALSGHPDKYRVEDDVLATMQQLAYRYRKHLNVPVLAVTGSNGKTTNKNLLATLLAAKYRIHYTEGNYNNHIGLPLTILNAPHDTEFLLLEMGTNHFGEIRTLCDIAAPDFGSILNIGKTHLEFLHSVEGVLQAKSELADYLNAHNGQLFLNREEPSLEPLFKHPVRKIIFDRNHIPGGDYTIEIRRVVPGIELLVKPILKDRKPFTLKSALWGEHNTRNLIHALAVGACFNVGMTNMVEALSVYTPRDNRSQIISWRGHTVYLDAYNANPTSMAHAIKNFRKAHTGSAVLILGDMGELGESSHKEHEEILNFIDKLGFEEVFLVGKSFRNAGAALFPQFHYIEAVQDLGGQEWDGEAPILIKGSRFLALEKLLEI